MRKKIIKNIEDTFYYYYQINSFYSFKENMKKYIDSIFSKKNKWNKQIVNTQQINSSKINKKEIEEEKTKNKIDEIKKLDFFTSKDIQNENLSITKKFENFRPNYFNDNDEEENLTIGNFIKEVANISRSSLNESNAFLKILYKEYKNQKNQNEADNIIFTLYQFKKQFSSWVKVNDDYVEN